MGARIGGCRKEQLFSTSFIFSAALAEPAGKCKKVLMATKPFDNQYFVPIQKYAEENGEVWHPVYNIKNRKSTFRRVYVPLEAIKKNWISSMLHKDTPGICWGFDNRRCPWQKPKLMPHGSMQRIKKKCWGQQSEGPERNLALIFIFCVAEIYFSTLG